MNDPRSAQPKPRVLVVDDQPLHIRDIYRVLSNDYQVLQATSGARGLQLAQTSAPDILLLDVAMPGLDGYALCTALRNDPATAEIPVIFLANPEDAIDRARCVGLGAVDILSKPVVAGPLSATVAKWIKKPADPVSQAGTMDCGPTRQRGWPWSRRSTLCRIAPCRGRPVPVSRRPAKDVPRP